MRRPVVVRYRNVDPRRSAIGGLDLAGDGVWEAAGRRHGGAGLPPGVDVGRGAPGQPVRIARGHIVLVQLLRRLPEGREAGVVRHERGHELDGRVADDEARPSPVCGAP